MSTPKALIFDLDGVLVNTVQAHVRSWSTVSRELGVQLTPHDHDRLRGLARRDGLAWLARNAPVNTATTEYLLDLKARTYRAEIGSLGEQLLVSGVDELLRGLRSMKMPIAVASASKHAALLLARAGLSGLIDVLSDGNFNGKLKPDPEQLLNVAAKLGVTPESCLVIEDSDAGLEAARRAGMQAMAIGEVAANAFVAYQVKSLSDVSLEEFMTIISAGNCHPE